MGILEPVAICMMPWGINWQKLSQSILFQFHSWKHVSNVPTWHTLHHLSTCLFIFNSDFTCSSHTFMKRRAAGVNYPSYCITYGAFFVQKMFHNKPTVIYKLFGWFKAKQRCVPRSCEVYVDGWIQDCSTSSVLPMEILQSCTKSSMCTWERGRVTGCLNRKYVYIKCEYWSTM